MAEGLSSRELQKLRKAIEVSRRQLTPFRRNMRAALREYVGIHYSDDGAADKVPMNLLELTVNVYRRHLVAGTPQILAVTKRRALKVVANKMKAQVNRRLKQMQFGETLRQFALNALFGMGIVKVGADIYAERVYGEDWLPLTESYAEVVSLDDWVHDMAAKRYDQVTFAGNRFRLPYDMVMESNFFKNTENLKPRSAPDTLDEGERRFRSISRSESSQPVDYRPFIELWSLWLPMDNLLAILPVNDGEPLSVERWEGPESGPYHLLNYADVPDQVLGLPPAALWMDLHTLSNVLYRKLGRQAERQKTVGGYRGTATGDAKRVQQSKDGDLIAMDDPEGLAEHSYGGIDQVNLAFLLQTIDKYSWLVGNLDAMGGLGPQSETLGQDRMLTESANERLVEMQRRTYEVVKRICEDIAWHEYVDPLKHENVTLTVEGVPDAFEEEFAPEERQANFELFEIDIEPYSLQAKSPSQRLDTIMQLLERFILPAMPMLEAQGLSLNVEGLLRIFAEYTNMTEMEDIVTFTGPPPEGEEGLTGRKSPSERPLQSPVTTRKYERVNRPAGTRQGKDEALAQALLGKPAQRSELAAAVR